jgi:hypothetical protein
MPSRQRRGRARLPLDDTVGQYLLNQPLVRSVREHPEIAVPWIVLGLAAALAGLIAGGIAVLVVLTLGFWTLQLVRAYAPRPRDRPSDPVSAVRQALILGWVVAMAAVIVIVALVESATGYTGIVTVVGLVVALPIAGRALYLILRV